MEAFQAEIVRLKQAEGVTKLAKRLGVARQMVYRWLAGEKPSLDAVERIGGKVVFGSVAQLVEQSAHNAQVDGSIPSAATISGRDSSVVERLPRKQLVVGSNPAHGSIIERQVELLEGSDQV